MRILLFITLLLTASVLRAQEDSLFRLVRTHPGRAANAFIDNLDNLYVVTETGGLKKYNGSGDSVGVFNGMRNFGKLHSVDVSNPLRLLLFYRDFSTIVILDRQLSLRATLDLRRQGIVQASAIGLSYDNNIWVFDELESRLKKVDEEGRVLLSTPDFRQLFQASGKAVVPQKILDDNGLVYLADTASGIFVFDNMGSFKKKHALTGWKSLYISGGRVVGLQDEGVVFYNPSTFLQTQQPLPASFRPYFYSFTGTNRLLLFTPEGLKIYAHRFDGR